MFREEEIIVDIDIDGIDDNEIDVTINIDELFEYESEQEQKDFIMSEVYKEIRKQYNLDLTKNKKLINNISFDLREFLDMLDDDGGILPNETYEEYMEHENFDD